jgi:VIT1/CCC1 family predicted Fe2+/Mn2+ transporter
LLAAVSSTVSFASGAAVPLALAMLVPAGRLAWIVFGGALALLMVLGAIGARLGGAPQWRAALRVAFWGVVAMGATTLIGRAFGVSVSP